MSNIHSIDPEKFIENSKGRFFQIFLVTNRELLSWTKRGFHNAEMDAMSPFGKNIEIFRKDEVTKEYYSAIRNARDLQVDGALQIVELPLFSNEE